MVPVQFPAKILARDGETRPSTPLNARETSVTALSSGDAFSLAAGRAVVTPRHGEAAISRQPRKETEEVALLLLSACGGGRGQEEQQEQLQHGRRNCE